MSNHPLFACIPKVKIPSGRLRNQSCSFPNVNKERFKQSFANRLIFRYNLAVDIQGNIFKLSEIFVKMDMYFYLLEIKTLLNYIIIIIIVIIIVIIIISRI